MIRTSNLRLRRGVDEDFQHRVATTRRLFGAVFVIIGFGHRSHPLMPRRPKGKSRRAVVPLRTPPGSQDASHFTDIYLVHQKLIGRLVLSWSFLEGSMQVLIWEFLNLSMSDGRIITSRLDASTMIPMLRSLAIRHIADQTAFQEFLDDLATVDGYRNDRNFVVHGSWLVLQPENIPAAMSLRPEAEAGGIVTETFPTQRMREIIRAIRQYHKKFIALETVIRTSRDKFLRQLPRD
jgi:hypothetical protein